MNNNNYLKEFTLENGLMVIVSGPSGAGKSALCRLYEKDNPNTYLSVSETTRKARGQEENGVEYFFISEEEFQQREDLDYYLETAGVYQKHYGTPKEPILKALSDGKNVILEIDMQGARQVKKIFPEAVTIFVLPENFSALDNRLSKRETETPEQKAYRLSQADREIEQIKSYDYVIINENNKLKQTEQKLADIIIAERHSVKRILDKEENNETK